MHDLDTTYICIGRGNCGSVWANDSIKGSEYVVIKRGEGRADRSITNEYTMHNKVLHCARQYAPTVPISIPDCYALIQPTDEWWNKQKGHFPDGYGACRALRSERIPKNPRHISYMMVDLYCGHNSHFLWTSDTRYENCLIRPYLGRRRHGHYVKHGFSERRSHCKGISLLNITMHVDQMEILELDTNSYAEAMAESLALMHWGARVDALGVEFVLAPPRISNKSPVFHSTYMGKHCMWILDFDRCKHLSWDDAGIEVACTAFWKNDPYYPRPGASAPADIKLWKAFRQRYLMASRKILREKVDGEQLFLADKFIDKIEDKMKLEEKKRAERQKKFQEMVTIEEKEIIEACDDQLIWQLDGLTSVVNKSEVVNDKGLDGEEVIGKEAKDGRQDSFLLAELIR